MNHKMNLKIGLVGALLLGQSLASAAPTYFQTTKFGSRLTTMDNSTPTTLVPIRVGKGAVQIDRIETTWDASKNETNMKATTICKQNYDVKVFDLRNQPSNYYYTSGDTICKDTVGNTSVEIHAGSSLLLIDGLSQGMPTVKLHSAFAYIGINGTGAVTPDIPYIRGQDSFTVDLNQVHFGSISFTPAGVMCQAESEPVSPNPMPGPSPSPRIAANSPPNCTVIYPVSYQAIWMAEDAP